MEAFYYIKVGDDVVATALVSHIVRQDEDHYVVGRVFVPFSFRGKGYGKAVMKKVIADADRERAILVLIVQPDDCKDFTWVRSFYGRLGFKRWKTTRGMMRLPKRISEVQRK